MVLDANEFEFAVFEFALIVEFFFTNCAFDNALLVFFESFYDVEKIFFGVGNHSINYNFVFA